MSMPTNLTPPLFNIHAMYIPEYASSTPALTVPSSPQVPPTLESSSSTIKEEEFPTCDTTSDDKRDFNQNNAPINNEDVHMSGRHDATNLEQLYVDFQAS